MNTTVKGGEARGQDWVRAASFREAPQNMLWENLQTIPPCAHTDISPHVHPHRGHLGMHARHPCTHVNKLFLSLTARVKLLATTLAK